MRQKPNRLVTYGGCDIHYGGNKIARRDPFPRRAGRNQGPLLQWSFESGSRPRKPSWAGPPRRRKIFITASRRVKRISGPFVPAFIKISYRAGIQAMTSQSDFSGRRDCACAVRNSATSAAQCARMSSPPSFQNAFDAAWSALEAQADLTPARHLVGLFLARRAFSSGGGDRFGASVREVREATRLGEKTVRRAIEWLHERKIFEIAEPARGRRPAQFKSVGWSFEQGQHDHPTARKVVTMTTQNDHPTELGGHHDHETSSAHIKEHAGARAAYPSSTFHLDSERESLPPPSIAREARAGGELEALRALAEEEGLVNGTVDEQIKAFQVAGGALTDVVGFLRHVKAYKKRNAAAKGAKTRATRKKQSLLRDYAPDWVAQPLMLLSIDVNRRAVPDGMPRPQQEYEAREFVNYYTVRKGSARREADWHACWQSWIGRKNPDPNFGKPVSRPRTNPAVGRRAESGFHAGIRKAIDAADKRHGPRPERQVVSEDQGLCIDATAWRGG